MKIRRSVKLVLGVAILPGVLLFSGGPTGAARADNLMLTYSVSQARAYVNKQELTAATIQKAPKCQANPPAPQEPDKYGCDKSQYEHKVDTADCGPGTVIGPSGTVVDPKQPAGVTSTVTSTVQSISPVALQEFLSLGRMARIGDYLEAGGLASFLYVDLDGRQRPDAHTESDGFITNRNAYEERCKESAHLFSRSKRPTELTKEPPETFDPAKFLPDTAHLAQCQGGCTGSGGASSSGSFDQGSSIVHLYEAGGKVFGFMNSTVQGLHLQQTTGTDSIFINSVDTFVSFESDGTPSGLKYTVVTTASGIKVAGQSLPVSSLQSDATPISQNGFEIRMTKPYAGKEESTTSGATKLTIVAPGLFIKNTNTLSAPSQCQSITIPDPRAPSTCQSTDPVEGYYAGAELRSTFNRVAPPTLSGGDFTPTFPPFGTITTETPGTPGFFPGFGPQTSISLPQGASVSPPSSALADGRHVSIKVIPASAWVVGSLLGVGTLGMIVLMVAWVQRFGWVSQLFKLKPFRGFGWMHRAFVRT